MKKTILFLFLLMLFASAKAQTRGKVTDGDRNLPFWGVTIQIKGTSQGTSTDASGVFSIATNRGDTLTFSFVGYKTEEYVIRGNEEVNITLYSDETIIDEVIVVGYGVQKKSDITGSVASVNTETLETRPSPNIIQSLQGTVAGLNISITGSNAEGSSTTTLIRGSNSITASNKPLIILDGVPFSGSWSEINPNDIQSIEVLKDASSSAIYGARGANGVILIQTKKGKQGEKVTISYEASYTTSKPINIPKMMDGNTFYARKEEAGLTFSFTEMQMHDQGRSTDWLDLALRTGNSQQHNLSIRGSGNNSRYYISGNFIDNKGISINDKFSRATIRINFDQDLGDFLTIGTSTQYGFYDRSGKEADFDDAFLMNPLSEPYDANGNIRLSTWEDNNYSRNPLSSLNEINTDHTNILISNNYLDIKLPIEGLAYKLNTGYTFQTSLYQNYMGRDTYEGAQANGILNIRNAYQIDWLIENILSYNRTFGKHNIFLTGLYSAQSFHRESNSMEARDFPNDVMTYYQPDKGSLLTASASQTKSSHLSQMLRANYSFDSRYLFTATVRRDGYSAFGNDNKYGIFPSVAIGWNISNESFLDDTRFNDVVNNLKVRLSWGKNGNEAISSYASLPVLRSLDYLTDDHTPAFGFFPSQLASPLLGWETTTSTNIGLDFGLLENRITGSIDLYSSQTFDLLLSRSIPSINGTNDILENIGETRGRGAELQISSVNISGNRFKWSTDFNIVHHKTELVDVGLYDEEGMPIDDIASGWFIGSPVNVNYDYVFDGIYQQGEVPPDAPFNSQPGYIRYLDRDEDGEITPDEDKDIIGSRYPDFTAGINNTFSYGNLSMAIFINTMVGATMPNYLQSVHSLSFRENQLDKDFWSTSNPINTYPANVPDGSVNPTRMFFYEKTDFLRIQDISIAYKLPGNIIERTGFERLEVYCNIKNLYTLTNWTGLDPEFTSSGRAQRAIPQTRQIVLGLRTTF